MVCLVLGISVVTSWLIDWQGNRQSGYIISSCSLFHMCRHPTSNYHSKCRLTAITSPTLSGSWCSMVSLLLTQLGKDLNDHSHTSFRLRRIRTTISGQDSTPGRTYRRVTLPFDNSPLPWRGWIRIPRCAIWVGIPHRAGAGVDTPRHYCRNRSWWRWRQEGMVAWTGHCQPLQGSQWKLASIG